MKQELDHYCLYVWEMKNYIFHYIPWFIKNIGDEELFRGSLLLKISEIKIYFRGIFFFIKKKSSDVLNILLSLVILFLYTSI